MAKTTIIFGVLLIGLGIVGYSGGQTETVPAAASSGEAAETSTVDNAPEKSKSVTALIPAFVGIALAACGLVALKESFLKHAMHAAAVVGLLGTIAGAGRGAMGLGKFFSGDPSLNQRSFLFVWLMAVICGAFVFLCIQSFRAARKKRNAD